MRVRNLLCALRRERNGAAVGAMRFYGRAYGLNYGVSLPAVRALARAEHPDHDFARGLYLKDVRELKLASFHIAQRERVTVDELDFWAAGISNSELAEEAAFALFSRVDCLPELFAAWIDSRDPLLAYTAILSAARATCLARAAQTDAAWIAPTIEAVRRNARPATNPSAPSAARLIALGAAALLTAIASHNEENRQAVLRAAGSLGTLSAETLLREELAWRLDS